MRANGARAAVWLLLALAAVFSALPQDGLGYSNHSVADWQSGGPHRVINRAAVERFIEEAETDPAFSNYDFGNGTLKVSGPRMGAPGMFVRGNLSGVDDKPETFQWWVIEGGYSADEPELYASFRHFYDPRAKEIGQPAHLTDHLDELGTYLKVVGRSMQLAGQPLTGQMVVEIGRNPEVDARDWAINGTAHEGWGENEYSWNKGVEYMGRAFASTDGVEKSRYAAQAWRALGETLHLSADMTVPAHVRNDSHPAFNINWWGLPVELRNPDPNVGMLKGDPYENWAQDAMVSKAAGGDADAEMADYVDSSKDPLDLFDRVAFLTNSTFFSGETISGTDPATGEAVHSANGMPDHPSPRLEQTEYDAKTGTYTKTLGDKTVCMAHRSWVSAAGWGMADPRITRRCVESQASVLVPVAVAGNAKLMDWFVPRVQVEITDVDTDAHTLRGTFTHEPYGAYKTAMTFSTADDAFSPFYLNGSAQDFDDYQLEVKGGAITLTYGDTVAANIESARADGDAVVALAIDMAGIEVRSNEFPLSETTPTPTPAGTARAAGGGGGAWVLKSTEPLKVVNPPSGCYNSQTVTGSGLSATTFGKCTWKGPDVDVFQQTEHSWSAVPPPRLAPGDKLQITATSSISGTFLSGANMGGGATTTVRIDLVPGGGPQAGSAAVQAKEPSPMTASATSDYPVAAGSKGGLLIVALEFNGVGGKGHTKYIYEWQEP